MSSMAFTTSGRGRSRRSKVPPFDIDMGTLTVANVRQRVTNECWHWRDMLAERIAWDKTENGICVPRGMELIGKRSNWVYRLLTLSGPCRDDDAELLKAYTTGVKHFPV